MSRTDLDATTLANSLRMMAGDGSIEWVYEPIQASVLLDIADILTENAKLRELVKGLMGHVMDPPCEGCIAEMSCDCSDLTQCDEWLFFEADARRLGIEVGE